jgi:hypothetical protein
MPTHIANLRSASIESKINSETFTTKDRLKVSSVHTTYFTSFQFGQTGEWDSSRSSGGTTTYNATLGGMDLGVSSTLNSESIFQTRRVMSYVPGRSSGLSGAYRLSNLTPGIRYRWGLFDENNGAFIEVNGNEMYCVVRSNTTGSVVDNSVPRSLWNEDKLDGSGRSGIILDLTKQQLPYIEYEWYGAGEVKYYFVIDGRKRLVHVASHANHISTVYCRTPFLPIRAEVKNLTGATEGGTLHFGSVSHVSEGEGDRRGQVANIASPITGYTLTTADTFYPVFSGRLKSTTLNALVKPIGFRLSTLGHSEGLHFKVLFSGNLTGGTWVDAAVVDPVSQFNTTATAISSTATLFAGYQPPATAGQYIEFLQDAPLGRGSLGTVSDMVTLAVAGTSNNTKVMWSIDWIEER